nr:hypothetical protein [Tanacetum cinerariifolium]
MENLPPPNDNLNALEEEPFMDQAPAAFVKFAPQWIGEQIPNNNNGRPHNRPPPTFDEENEFAPPVVRIADVDNIPIPPVIQFGNFHVGESSASRDLLKGNGEVCVPGLMPYDLRSAHRGVKRNGQAFDIIALNLAVRANRSENSKMMRLITDLSREFSELKSQNRRAEELSHWEAWNYASKKKIPNQPSTHPNARGCRSTCFHEMRSHAVHRTEDVVGLVRWFEKMENTFEISECAEVATLGREVANARSWAEVKQMMTDEFCPTKEVHRLEDELRHLKLRDMNIAAYTERFNELALVCPDVVPNEKKNVELYIKGLPEIIKGETTSSRLVTLNEAVRIAHVLMEQKIQSKNERIAEEVSEDSSKKERKIDEIDQDLNILLIKHNAEIRGRVTTTSVDISPARRVSTANDINMAETFMYIRRSAAKDKAVRLQEELDEEKRQRMARFHEAAQAFTKEEYENIRARVEAYEELTQRLQAEERNKYSEVDQAKMLVDLIN